MTRGRVLVLEDDLALRGLLLEALLGEDLSVRVCDSFDSLKLAAAQRDGDLVLADFWGGGQRTLGDAERAQIEHLTSLLPVVLLTGRSWAINASAEELGAAALIRKPFDLGHLLATVDRILSDERTDRANR
jgi:DNA-binding NtrC family response regulator